MTAASGWCIDGLHTSCRYLNCTCDCHTLAEQGRRLTSRRDDLIAAGADPAALLTPVHPDDVRRRS